LRWYYVLDAPPSPDGKRRRKWSTGFPTKRAADTALREELGRRDQGLILSTEKVTVRGFADRWLEYMTTLGRDERTLERYRELLELHALPAIGGLQLNALQPVHLADLYAAAWRSGASPTKAALAWPDVDLDQGTVRIGRSRRIVGGQMQVKGPKTEAGYRTVALGPTVIAALRRLRAEQAERRLILGADYHDEDLVICKPDGRPYRPDSTSTQFRKFVDSIGLPKTVHVHTLRHSAASFLAAAGVPASDIAAQLGHRDGGALALRIYVHPLAEGLARAGAHLDQVVGEAQ
jgi:integrase